MKPLDLKYGTLVGWAAICGWIVSAVWLFLGTAIVGISEEGGYAQPVSIAVAFLSVCYYLFGVKMMLRVWKDIAQNGIHTDRMMLPGIVACSTVGAFLFVGLLLSGLKQYRKDDKLTLWEVLVNCCGVLFIIFGVISNIGGIAIAVNEWSGD